MKRTLLAVCLAASLASGVAGTSIAAARSFTRKKTPAATALPAVGRATFVGRLVEVAPAPGFWSGVVWAKQVLTYEVVAVDKGDVRGRLAVPFSIVSGAPMVDTREPKVAAAFTRIGARYIVTVEQHKDYGLLAVNVTSWPKK